MGRLRKIDIEESDEANEPTDASLVARYIALRDWIAGEKKRFDEHLKASQDEMDGIENDFLRRLNERGTNSSPTDYGTAYKVNQLNVKVSPEGPSYTSSDGEVLSGRDALLTFALDNWETIGDEMLMISAQKDAVKKYITDTNANPPGVKTEQFVKINIKRS